MVINAIETLEDLKRVVSNIIGLCPHDWSIDIIEATIAEAISEWRDKEERR